MLKHHPKLNKAFKKARKIRQGNVILLDKRSRGTKEFQEELLKIMNSRQGDLEIEIRKMGYGFRDLTYHSDGRYSCRLGDTFMKGIRGTREFWGETPLEAVIRAHEALLTLEKEK